MGRAGSCSKRTNPSPARPVRAEVAERQPSASHYRRIHGRRGRLDPDPAELREEDWNRRTKWLRRQPASWDRRIASVEIERKAVEGSLVGDKEIPAVGGTLVEGGCRVHSEHRHSAGEGTVPAVGEKSRVAGGKESPVVGDMAFLAVKHTVEGVARLVVEGRVNPVVVAEDTAIPAEIGAVAVDSYTEEPLGPEVPETGRAY